MEPASTLPPMPPQAPAKNCGQTQTVQTVNCSEGTAPACSCDHSPASPVSDTPLGQSSPTLAIYRIMDMCCPMEEALIRNKLEPMPGITGLECNLVQRTLSVHHTLPSTTDIEAALTAIGMAPMSVTGPNEGPPPETRIHWLPLAVAGLCATLSEAFELLHEWGASPFGMTFLTAEIGGFPVAGVAALAFACIAIFLSGTDTYKKGWLAVKNGTLNINALMSVAVTGAALIGQFPEAAMVMVLFTLSEAIEAKALDRMRGAIKDMLALAPDTATVALPDGGWAITDIRQVPVGSRVRVHPGEKIALDGVIVQGQSAINQAPITGESLPVDKEAGDTVYAGTINEYGSFDFTVTALATDSTLARIIHAVEKAQSTRAPIQRFVDAFARYYTPAVFVVSLLVALGPPLFMGGAWKDSIYTGLVILVISCPCALVISTPVSIVSGMAAAVRSGILVKGGVYLEQGRLLSWLALDKTGTLTHGKPHVTDFLPFGGADAREVCSIAASLTSRSDHPVSRAIAKNAAGQGLALYPVTDFRAIPGQGVCGNIFCRGEDQLWHVGNRRMVEELGQCSPELEEIILTLEKQGKTVVLLAGRTGVAGVFAVADTLRESAVSAIQELKTLGVKTIILTGDNQHTAEAIASQAGVDRFVGNLLPEDKLRIVAELEKEGRRSLVGMVGDGINDAPALAQAGIGFAMAGGGTDTAIETADVALMDDDLRKIPRFIRLSKATYAILVQNIVLALSIKALFFGLTFAGHATMWMAVFADVGTALLVIINGLRARRK